MSLSVSRKAERWAFIGVLVLAVGLRLFRLGQESLWFDEGWSALIAQMSWPTLRNVLLTQPFPFYYGLLNLWAHLGQTEFALRLLSALAGGGSVALLYPLSARLLGRRTALWAALLLAISPLHIWYSQEARMYTLGTLLGLAATWAYLKALADRRWWIAYAVLCAVALYTFYYAALIIVVHSVFTLYLLWRHHLGSRSATGEELGSLPEVTGGSLRGWALSQVGAAALFAPGLWVLLGQMTGGTWEWVSGKYGRPGLSDLVGTALAYSLGDTWVGPSLLRWLGLLGFVLAILAAIGVLQASRQRIAYTLELDKPTLFWLFYLALPIGAIFAVSQLKPGYLIRYLVLFLPAFCVLAGKGLAALRPALLRFAIVVVILVPSALSLADLYGATQKEEWRPVAQQIQDGGQPGDVILLVDQDASAILSYYYHGPLPVVGASGSLQSDAELEQVVQSVGQDAERVWLIVTHVPDPALLTYLSGDPRFELERDWQVIGIQLALFRRVS